MLIFGFGFGCFKSNFVCSLVGGVEQALPHFDGEGGLCTQLAPILGDMSQSADRLQNRRGVSNSVAIQGAGDGSEDGSTRRNITIWMEDTMARVLTKALEQYPDQKARPGMIL